MANMGSVKMNPARNRLIGAMPKVGIRPTMDGRRKGVRESLEDQTMALARSVAVFLEKNLRHANGLPHVGLLAADTGLHAQRAGDGGLPAQRLECFWCAGSDGGRLPRLCGLRPAVRRLLAIVATRACSGLAWGASGPS